MRTRAGAATLAAILLSAHVTEAQPALRKIGELELAIRGVRAVCQPAEMAVPRNTPTAVRVVVSAGSAEMSLQDVRRLYGSDVLVEGELAGPEYAGPVSLVSDPAGDPLSLPIPAIQASGDYEVSNLRLTAAGRTVLDVAPSPLRIQVIDQVLVTSVRTRPLTLEEIRARGIDLRDAENYLGFSFTLGLLVQSQPVHFSFPVVFDRNGVIVPEPLAPPPTPPRISGISLPRMPTVVPMLLEPVGDGSSDAPPPAIELPSGGGPVRIPGLLVIPGDVGYLKQFFSAQLFVQNGAPSGSGLSLTEVTGRIVLPPAAGSGETPPLALPPLVREGESLPQPDLLPVLGVGPDGKPGTADDTDRLSPGEQGVADFTIRGDAEGFHAISFDIGALLSGLPTGPVRLRGQAKGGVLVRNASFNMTFSAPAVVRSAEPFKLHVTVTNVGRGTGHLLRVSLGDALSGLVLADDEPGWREIETLAPGDSTAFAFDFVSQRTGQVTASYLRFDAEEGAVSGDLRFHVGVGERGVPLSPDTLVLPTAVDALPPDVVAAAMRVLGQAWSVVNAPYGTLPPSVQPIDRAEVVRKVLALAEAGLRTRLGQPQAEAVRDLLSDFWSGDPEPDPGFDQLLGQTAAGRDLAAALGAFLADPVQAAGGASAYERELSRLLASGPDFIAFSLAGTARLPRVELRDDQGRQASWSPAGTALDRDLPGQVFVPLGAEAASPLLALLTAPRGSRYELSLFPGEDGVFDLSLALPRGDGAVVRGSLGAVALRAGEQARVLIQLNRPRVLALEHDLDRDGEVDAVHPLTIDHGVGLSEGPRLMAARVIGPDTLASASPAGVSLALLFDRTVDADTAANAGNYSVPKNRLLSPRRQLSGRLVFAALDQPEGDIEPTTISVDGVADRRGVVGLPVTESLVSLVREPGGMVAGRVLNADGSALPPGVEVYYLNETSLDCPPSTRAWPVSRVTVDDGGGFEFRYVRRSLCGHPFELKTQDPATGALRTVSGHVRQHGERLWLDIVLRARGSVTGTVRRYSRPPQAGELDPPTAPAAGVTVVALSLEDPQSGGRAVTDGDGRYVIDGVTVGPVSVRAGGATGVGHAAGRIERPGTPAVIDILLDDNAASLGGTVYRVDLNEPDPSRRTQTVPGLQVLYSVLGAQSSRQELVAATTTDAQGRYRFDAVPVGAYTVSVALNQRDRGSASGSANVGENPPADVVITIPRVETLGTLRGTVRLPDGSAPPATLVTVGDLTVLAAADGSYEIAGVPITATVVLARTTDGKRSATHRFRFPDAPSPEAVADLLLSGLGAARFIVLDPQGRQIHGQAVFLEGGCLNPCGCRSAQTGPGDDQPATFSDLPVGLARARAYRPGGGTTDVATGSVTISRDGEMPLGILRFAGTGVVHGLVTAPGPTGSPAPAHGASVQLTSRVFVNDGVYTCGLEPRASTPFVTGPDGRFRFSGVHLGAFSLGARADFFGAGSAAGASGTLTADGQEAGPIELLLTDAMAGVLSGTVYLPDGITPVGAAVEVRISGPLPEVMVRTDAAGAFRFAPILPAGLWTLTAVDPQTGGIARRRVALSRGQPASHDLRLLARGRVTVRVVDGAGQPLDEALVRLQEADWPNGSFDAVLSPSSGGLVEFSEVHEGPLVATASEPHGRGGRATGVMPHGGSAVEMTVRVTSTGSVTGVFRLPGGVPVPLGEITLKADGQVVGRITTPASGDVGRFRFDYVPVGSIRVEAVDPLTARTGFAAGRLESEGQELVLDVTAQALGTVTGPVTLNGTPEPRARISLASGSFAVQTLADAVGVYRVEGVPEGRVVVTAQRAGGGLAGSAAAQLSAEGEVLPLPVALREAGAVEGTVRSVTGDPAPLCAVTVTAGGVTLDTTTREADGFFRVDFVPSGPATVEARALGSIDRVKRTVDVPARDTVSVELALTGVGSVEGVVSGVPDGYQSEVTLTSTGPYPASYLLRPAPGPNGSFRLPEILAGPVTATLKARGALTLHGTASAAVTAGAVTALAITVQPTGAVEGEVLTSRETPAIGAEVELVSTQGTLRATAAADGRFRLPGVPEGPVSVRVRDPLSGGLGQAEGTVVRDQTLALPTIVLDDEPPVLEFVQPAPGSTRRGFEGPLVVQASADVDPTTFVVRYLGRYSQGAGEFTFADGQFSGALRASVVQPGENRLIAEVKDLSGNLSSSEIRFTVTGGTVRGWVLAADGRPAAAVPVRTGSGELLTDAAGHYRLDGLRAGSFWARATDPATGFDTDSVSGTLEDGAELVFPDLVLPAVGSIAGTVVRADTVTPAGPGLTVSIGARTFTTDADSAFVSTALLPGTYTVEARHPNGDRGRRSVVVGAGEPTTTTIVLNGMGSVRATVRKSDGSPAAGAVVTVVSSADGLPDPEPMVADGEGQALFPSVPAGEVSARASYRGQQVSAPTQLLSDAGHLDFTILLGPSARLAGTVQSAGLEPVVGATVRLSGPRSESVVSGAGGAFEFTEVPYGAFTLEAATADDDKARVSGVLGSDPATVVLTLAGFGDLTVLVRDTNGDAVSGAQVVATSVAFGSGVMRTSDLQGRAEFLHLRGGEISLDVTSGGRQVLRSVTLPAGESLTETVVLSAFGTVHGVVREPGSEAGVAGVEVSAAGRTVVTGADGLFSMDDLTAGSHFFTASVAGRLRARWSVLVRSGETTDGSVELVGVGTIRGVVRQDGVPVANALVRTQSYGTFGGIFETQSAADGSYVLAGLPAQSELLSVTATMGEGSAAGSARLEFHGQEIVLDFSLLANAVQVPRSLFDGNQVSWQIQPDGSMRGAHIFATASYGQGGPRLSLVGGADQAVFVGRGQSGLEATEEAQRETVLRQEGLLGLRVTRKVFVPQGGYFVRYLEVLENDGDVPVAVDVLLTAAFTSFGYGSAQLLPQASPAYLVVDDTRTVDFYTTLGQTTSQLPPVGIALGSSATQSPEVTMAGGELRCRWPGVLVPARGRVAVLHAWTVQADRDRAAASAERLSGLPPELLAGLDAAEAAAVRNFEVPQDLQSVLPALPPNDGVVTGRVLAGDGATPAPATTAVFRSRSPHYGRPTPASLSDGSFVLSPGSTTIVPRTDFDLRAQGPDFGGVSTSEAGGFDSSGVVELSASEGRAVLASSSRASSSLPTQAFDFDLATLWRAASGDRLDQGHTSWLEVTFPRTVTVHRVSIRGPRGSEAYATRGRLELYGAGGEALASFGPFDLPAPYHDADVSLPAAVADVVRVRFVALEGSGAPGVAEFQVFGEGDVGALRRADLDVVFRNTGILDARVLRADGSPLSGYQVTLSRGPSASRWSASDGRVRFALVPEATDWTLRAVHPLGGASVSRANLTVTSGPVAPEIELRFSEFGSVTGTLLRQSRDPIGGSVTLAGTGGFSRHLSVGAQGAFAFADVPAGTYTLTATDSSRSAAIVTTPAFLVAEGAGSAQEVVFPAIGTLRVTATSAGQVYPGARVRWRSPSSGIDWRGPYSTDAAGAVTIANVAGPTIDIEVSRPDLPISPLVRTVALAQELAVLDEVFDLPATTLLTGTLRSLSGVAYPSRTVEAWSEASATRVSQTTTNATGGFSLSVPPGVLWLQAPGYCHSARGEVRVDPAVTSSVDALLPRGTVVRPGQRDFWEMNLAEPQVAEVWVAGANDGDAPGISDASLLAYGPDGSAADVGYSGGNIGAGRYLLSVGGDGDTTGGYDLCGFGSPAIFRAWSGPWARGTVTSGGVPFAGARVRLVRAAQPAVETAADDAGAYALPLVTPGDFAVEVFDASGLALGRATASADLETDVTVPPVDVPERASVSVYVERGGAAVAGVEVTLASDNPDALAEDARRTVTTGDDGQASAVLPAGLVTATLDPVATACDRGPSGSAACSDARPTPADFVFTLPDLPTRLIVQVTALEPDTPLPSAHVEVVGLGLMSAVNADGIAVFDAVPAGRRSVRAWLADREALQTVDLAGGETGVALALPVPAIRATLADSHGAAVSGAAVEACGTRRFEYCGWYYCYSYEERTCAAASPTSTGAYVLDQFEPWLPDHGIAVTGRPTGSNARAEANLIHDPASSTVYRVPLQLPPTGRLRGVVVEADDATPVPNAALWISTDDEEPAQLVADDEGRFDAPYVLVEEVAVYAESPGAGIPGSVRISLAVDGDQDLRIRLVPSALLTLRFGDQTWSSDVAVESPEAPRRDAGSPWRRLLTPQPGQSVSLTVPQGLFRVFSDPDSLWCDAEVTGAEGVLTEATEIHLDAGSHLVRTRPLGPAGSTYGGDGLFCWWGDNPLPDMTVPGVESYPPVGTPRPEGSSGEDVRAIRTLLAVGAGLRTRQEQYVPASGGFGRTTVFIENPGSEPQSTTLQTRLLLAGEGPDGSTGGGDAPLQTQLLLDGEGWQILTTSDGDASLDAFDTWVVFGDGGGRVVGVILGTGLRRTAVLREGDYQEKHLEVDDTVDIPAGGSVAFSTFVLSRTGSAEDVALEIENLLEQDAVAFDGLSALERSWIVNLPESATGVAGTVLSPAGEPVPNAVVGVVSQGQLVAVRPADASGRFTLRGLSSGVTTLVARDPVTQRPGRLEVTLAPEVITPVGDLVLLPDSALGRVEVQVVVEGEGGPAVGETVEMRASDYGGFWRMPILTGNDGRAAAVGVPAGPLTLHWAVGADTRAAAGELAAEGVLQIVLQVPVSIETVPTPVGLAVEGGRSIWVYADGVAERDEEACVPLCGSYAYLNDEPFWGSYEVSLVRRREVVIPAEWTAGISRSRRTYVPTSGRFVRLVDVLENPGAEDLTVRYALSSSLEAPDGAWEVVATSDGDSVFTADDAFAVLRNEAAGLTAAIVRGGTSSPGLPDAPESSLDSQWGTDTSVWTSLTVPAGSTVRLMQFLVTVPDGPTSVDDARELARSLADLTEPSALFGLGAAEQASLLNFAGVVTAP